MSDDASLARSLFDLQMVGDFNRELDHQWEAQAINGRGVEAARLVEPFDCARCGWSDFHTREPLGYRCTWCRAVFTDEEG